MKAPPETARLAELPGWPAYSEAEVERVAGILRSGRVNYWTGEECRGFEREFAEYTGVRHAVALANGTLALELALRILDIGPGDEVIVTPRTYIASASSIALAGATPVFADVDPDTQGITADTIRAVLTPRTRAVMPVHLAGWPCPMGPIMELAREHDLKVIEDCAQAHGARCDGRRVGSFGHAAAFSFCQDKIISTGGEGGMLVTDDDELFERAWSFKDHGKSRAAVERDDHPPGYRWLHTGFGSNWRMTEMQAAMGRIQLTGLEQNISRRRELARVLDECFAGLPQVRLVPGDAVAGLEPVFYKYYLYVRPDALAAGWDRDRLLGLMARAGIPGHSGSCSEVYLEQCMADAGFTPADPLPVARSLGETSLMLSINHRMSDADARLIGGCMRAIILKAAP